MVLLFILAVIIRLIFINIFGGFSVLNAGDTCTYLTRAKSLLSGDIATFSTLGFSLYLALIFKIFGYPSLLIIQLVNVLLGSLTVLAIFTAGKEFYNKDTGFLAAFICIFHINLLLWTGYILTETLFILFLSLSILFFLKFANDKKLLSLFFALILLAISGLIRDIGFLLFIPAGIWVLLVLCKQYIIRILLVTIFLAILLSIPWVVTYKLLPLYENSVLQKSGLIDAEIHKGLLWNESGRGTSGVDMKPELLPLKIAQYSRNPYEYTNLMLRKLKAYWWFFTPESSFKHKAVNSLFFVPLYFLAVFGLIFNRQVQSKAVLLIMFAGFFTLASMIGIVDYDLRYHLPVDLIMIILSAYGGIILLEKIRKKRLE